MTTTNREAEIIELLQEIDAEVEDRWTLLRVKVANTRRAKRSAHPAIVRPDS